MIDEKNLIEIMLKMRDREHGTPKGTIDWFIQVIEACPQLNEWIPVSESKPRRQDSKNTIIEFYFVSTKRGNVRLGFRDEGGEWLTEHGNIIPNVIAWMPLPEPYKE